MVNKNPLDATPAPTSRREVAPSNGAVLSLAERRARALAPTIFCPASRVDQCVREAAQARMSS